MNKIPRNTCIAIDFGSTRTKVSYWHPETLQPTLVEIGREQNYILPSVFYVPRLPKTKILVGEEALDQLDVDPKGIILGIKKEIHQIGKIRLGSDRQECSRINLVEALFTYIRKFCEEKVLFTTCEDCILTFPVAFEQRQIDQLIKAAKRAGFGQVKIVEEPVAGAMSWLKYKSKHQDFNQVIICDIGGGTSDLALLKYNKGHFESDPRLKPLGFNQGGNDIDRNIWESIEQDSSEMGSDWYKSRDAFCNQIRKAKEYLLSDFRREIPLQFGEKEFALTRDRVQQESNPLVSVIIDETLRFVEKCQTICQQDKITLLLIGGGGRIPNLQESLELATNCPVIRWNYSDYATVLGALFHEQGVVSVNLAKTNKQIKNKPKGFQSRSLLVLASSVAIAISVAFGFWQILNFRKNHPMSTSEATSFETASSKDSTATIDLNTQEKVIPKTLSDPALQELLPSNPLISSSLGIKEEMSSPSSISKSIVQEKKQNLIPIPNSVEPVTDQENVPSSLNKTPSEKVIYNDLQQLPSSQPTVEKTQPLQQIDDSEQRTRAQQLEQKLKQIDLVKPDNTSPEPDSFQASNPTDRNPPNSQSTVEKTQPLKQIGDSTQRTRAQQLEQKLKQIDLVEPDNRSPKPNSFQASNSTSSNPPNSEKPITIDQLSRALISPTGEIPPISSKKSTSLIDVDNKVNISNETELDPSFTLQTKKGINSEIPYQKGLTAKNNKDYDQAFLLFQKAGSSGNAKALYELGNAFLYGLGTKSDWTKGKEYFQSSAQAGYDKAQRALGFLYENGFGGIAKNIEQAKYWYQLAADQGNQEAIEFLKRIP